MKRSLCVPRAARLPCHVAYADMFSLACRDIRDGCSSDRPDTTATLEDDSFVRGH